MIFNYIFRLGLPGGAFIEASKQDTEFASGV